MEKEVYRKYKFRGQDIKTGEWLYGKPQPSMSDIEFDETIRLAVATYGKDSQTQMLFEEMAELQNALCKIARKRGDVDQVCEEIADVMIMCIQMAQIYGPKRVEHWVNFKTLRLRDRLNHVDK